jgi:hypothetical protein
VGGCSEEECGRTKRRKRLEGMSSRPREMERWMYDGMVLKAANTKKINK